MKENPRNFNDAAKLFLLIAAFSAVKSIIKGFQIIGINGMLGYSTSGHVLQIVFGVIIIAAIVLTLMRKRYGLISLLLIAVSEMFVTYQPGSMISFSYHMGVQVTEFVFSYGMFLIAMLQEGRTLRMGFNANLRELCTRVSNQEWGEKRRLR